ncbi:hypothetical protein MNBD_GAMMA06-2025, partial [hydrothermal vent metagenome]
MYSTTNNLSAANYLLNRLLNRLLN